MASGGPEFCSYQVFFFYISVMWVEQTLWKQRIHCMYTYIHILFTLDRARQTVSCERLILSFHSQKERKQHFPKCSVSIFSPLFLNLYWLIYYHAWLCDSHCWPRKACVCPHVPCSPHTEGSKCFLQLLATSFTQAAAPSWTLGPAGGIAFRDWTPALNCRPVFCFLCHLHTPEYITHYFFS